ncbi:2-polyprenyl-6-methoxyphenol hydroxylase [Marinactinospora thermotolerans DSM 45154]|uniref:2-polyprenyl-6-methoxyphenol hydroxylase n=1 Tax=Marinactinospora thermotolerans DSM 45154 TaxID=1122192 RepID=A0A1T4SXC9_9ACTN|nr:FAD-dependent monooxygenase [Marinactinospora thermotolerans]SKA32920.1 2-polyprenyl-6-methoxyphenol hydroxylase [Marinactinospora thermotolerans DSM 45154]
MAQPHAVVVGGGIGGLAAAVALYRKGWAVTVCERAPAPDPAEVGLVLAPNALRALDTLGLGGAVRARSAHISGIEIRRGDGRRLLRLASRARRGFDGGAHVLLRSDLVDLLLTRLPAGVVHTATAVSSVEPGDTRRLARVGTEAGEVSADLVVAADGLRSAVRSALFLEHPGPVYAGFTTWSAVVPDAGVPVAFGETWGRGGLVGVLPLPEGRLHCYATANAPAGENAGDEKAELLGRLAVRHDPLPALFAAAPSESVRRGDVWHIDTPPPAYHKGRVALLGDAAHAMTPNLGQGAGQAIEDAVVLAHHVNGSTAYLPTALHSYTEARMERTAQTVQRSAQLAEAVQSESPSAVRLRDVGAGLLGRLAPGTVTRFLDRLYDWRPPVEPARV